MSEALPGAVYVIWAVTLLIVVLVLVPLVVVRLHRTLVASIAIERYLKNMLEAGVGIARNTQSVSALDDTIACAGGMVETGTHLNRNAQTIATVLAERAENEGDTR